MLSELINFIRDKISPQPRNVELKIEEPVKVESKVEEKIEPILDPITPLQVEAVPTASPEPLSKPKAKKPRASRKKN